MIVIEYILATSFDCIYVKVENIFYVNATQKG